MKTAARLLMTLLLAATAAFGAKWLWQYTMLSPWTRDGRIEADVVAVAPDVAGYISDVRVRDDQFVQKGDVLFTIDDVRYKLALATAQANVEGRRADMEMRQHIAERRARLTTLSTSEEDKQNTKFTADSAAAAYAAALADLGTARLNVERTVVRSPVNGFVTNLKADVGQYASVGNPVLAVIDSDSFHVEGFFEETKIRAIRPGARVLVTMMSGGPKLVGHVESVSYGITDRDNGRGPDLLASVTPTFEWVRLAQRIPVRIHIDSVPDGVQISAGETCTVEVVEDAPPAAQVSKWRAAPLASRRKLL